MRIGMLVAVDRELEALRSVGEDMSEEVVAARTVYRFELEGNEVFAVRSGCGAVDAAAGTMLLIARLLWRRRTSTTSIRRPSTR